LKKLLELFEIIDFADSFAPHVYVENRDFSGKTEIIIMVYEV
jgi:hypothetical protein